MVSPGWANVRMAQSIRSSDPHPATTMSSPTRAYGSRRTVTWPEGWRDTGPAPWDRAHARRRPPPVVAPKTGVVAEIHGVASFGGGVGADVAEQIADETWHSAVSGPGACRRGMAVEALGARKYVHVQRKPRRRGGIDALVGDPTEEVERRQTRIAAGEPPGGKRVIGARHVVAEGYGCPLAKEYGPGIPDFWEPRLRVGGAHQEMLGSVHIVPLHRLPQRIDPGG